MIKRRDRTQWLWRSALALLAGSLLIVGPACAGPTQTAQPKNAFALGVYWPWETTGHLDKETRAEKLEPFLIQRLDDLAAHGVNTVWTVNGPDTPEELGLLCRLAAVRGIRIVAGSGWWAMRPDANSDYEANEMSKHAKMVWDALDGKPRPIALTLADEPSRDYMDSFGRYAKRVAADGIPATTVCTWGDFPSAIEKASTLSIIAHDNYPFFASSNGPRGDSSYSYFTDNVASFVRKADVAGMVPWAMPQAYQEVWGPGKFDEKGNAIVLPGGGLNWQMPTAAQIRWQTWASVALGAKGVVFFAYAVTAKPDPLAKPVTMNWALTTETATGAPLGLVSWPEFSPSAQYRAMASSFAEVKPLCSLLSKLRAATGDKPLATLAADKAVPGDLVCVLSDAASSDYYVVVVASPKDGKRTLQVQLLPEVNHLLPLGGAPAPVLLKSGPARVTVTLEPGQGALYELVRRH